MNPPAPVRGRAPVRGQMYNMAHYSICAPAGCFRTALGAHARLCYNKHHYGNFNSR